MWYNPLVIAILNSPFHPIASGSALVLTYKGNKTGKVRSVPVAYVKDDSSGDLLLITFKRRKWWRSLRRTPEGCVVVRVRLRGKTLPATAEAITEPDEVRRDLTIYLRKNKDIARLLKIDFDDNGNPEPENFEPQVEKRVMVRIHLS